MATSPNNPVAIIAKATAAAPSYTEGDQVQVSIDLSGNMRITGSVTATAAIPVGITPTDRTITSMSGSSQQLMAAVATRKYMLISNTGNANVGVNPTGGTAVIGGAGTFTLVPGGSYEPRVPSLSAITVIGTAGQPIYANES